MENTLDSIRPSENPEMSYLFGRDPSILAYSQRPCPSKDMKKNLLSLYEEENNSIESRSTSEQSESLQTVKVYLRLKPFPKNLKLTEGEQEAYKIINSTTLVTKLPMIDSNASTIKQSKNNEIISRKFTFSQTFGPEITQLELFEQTVQRQMMDFLAGHNCTIMTYGTTNSGKSFTLQGTTTSPGLIPRALEFVFSNITIRPNPFYKPLHHCNVISLSALERAQELEAKTKLLTFSSVDKHQYMNAYKQMQKLLQEESIRPSQCHDAHYSIWVSFAEIYNEIVYDLLSNEGQKRRIPLKLGTDSSGRAFIKRLKTVYVNSAAEAYQVLMAGQYNLKIAATALNAKSSRSHCIFTITLLKYYVENSPNTVEVSTFSFCDLAGSERLKKTLNIGDRLKEAQNINTSLLVLGRCLKSIHEGQLTKAKVDAIGPFRESKLTRLFQRALSGKEHLALIVNVNPSPNLYVETQNVLNFAAIAKRIVIEQKKQVRKKLKSRFSQIVTRSIETVTDWDVIELESADDQHADTAEDVSEYVVSEEYMNLMNENEKLREEIITLKNSALIRDFQSRQEMAEKYIAMINELEADWKQRINDVESQHEDALEWTVKQLEDFYEKKLKNQVSRKKRRRSDFSDDSDEDNNFLLNETCKELNKETVQLRTKNETLTKTLTELKRTNEALIIEKNKATFELGLTKEDLRVTKNLLEAAQKDLCLNQDSKIYVKEVTSQLFAKDDQIKHLKEFLNEAKAEYINATFDLNNKQFRIDEQTKTIVENEEKIQDLELHLEQVNICLTEKTRIIEHLEEKLECQNEKLSQADNKILQLQEEVNQLKNEKLKLCKSYEKKPASTFIAENTQHKSEETDLSRVSTSAESKYEEIIIKEEFIIDHISESFNNTQDAMRKTVENVEEKSRTQMATSVNESSTTTDIINSDLMETLEGLAKENFESPRTNVTCSKPLHAMVEIGCQIDIEDDVTMKSDLIKSTCHKCIRITAVTTKAEYTQTSCNERAWKEEAVQTSEMFNSDDKLKLEEFATRYDTIQEQYEQECIKVKQLTEEYDSMRKTMQSLREENCSIKTSVDDYKHSAEILERQLSLATEEKRKMEDTLLRSNVVLEKQIADYKCEIDQLERNLSDAKINAKHYLEKLEATRKELGDYVLKDEQKKEMNHTSGELISIKVENYTDNASIKQLDERVDRLEIDLKTTAELKNNIVELSKSLETCQQERNYIQSTLDQNNKKLLEFESRLEETALREQEKDTEIATLQKELKNMIQGKENNKKNDDLLEAQLKNAMNELTQIKETLSQREQYIKELKIHSESYERSTKIFNLLEENAKERQIENERLRSVNDELRNNLTQKECEMDTFMKNRDETITKYETLVKNQQEELDMQKREVMRYQELFRRQLTPTPNNDDYKKLQNRIQDLQDKLNKYKASAKSKDYNDTTSEDEALSQRLPKRRGKKTVSSTKQGDIPVIELSGSESKRSTRRTAAPTAEVSTEKKQRATRKKKLFVANNSFVDIEPSENIIPSTSSSTRNLRTRKK